MTLYIVPIEPLEERYTEQWYRRIPDYFRHKGIKTEIIDGVALSNHVSVGTFLDINSTIHYKNSQLMKISELFHTGKIKDGDKFFFTDIEFWGVESLRLMADMNKKRVEIYGFLHAGSYTKEDAFEIAAPYQQFTELGWIGACDRVFVGTEYHKNAFISRRLSLIKDTDTYERMVDKIVVTGNPLFLDEYEDFQVEKKNQIIISNRFDYEKRPDISLNLALVAQQHIPDLKIVITTSRPKFKSNRQWLVDYARMFEKMGKVEIREGLTKREYHRTLAESKIMLSNSIEENFGYCIVEACLYNVYPILPSGLSHNELVNYDSRCLFDSEDEVLGKIQKLLKATHSVEKYAQKFDGSMHDIYYNMFFPV